MSLSVLWSVPLWRWEQVLVDWVFVSQVSVDFIAMFNLNFIILV